MILLHGGPGAPGYLGPLFNALRQDFEVVAPEQRGSGGERLTVSIHVSDLRDLCGSLPPKPAIVGHSWGAMLALAFASAHPELAGPVVLIGCGTFDSGARAERQRRRSLRPEPPEPDGVRFDQRAHDETWADMLRLQSQGVYPAAFRAIRSPVLMLHGSEDPHPGQMICDSLRPHIQHLEYRELPGQGHVRGSMVRSV